MIMNGLSGPRVGVVGCGNWGRHLARNFAELGALAGVSDIDPCAAAAQAERFGVPAISPEALIETSATDALAIATPAEDHAGLALAAIAAGKHVFVEKPIAVFEQDAVRMVDAAAAQGVTLMVGHVLRYHPCFGELQRIVQAGCIGRLQYIHTSRTDTRAFRRAENALWGFAPHDISMILSLTDASPRRVGAMGSNLLGKGGLDSAVAALEFPGGVSGHVFVSWLHFVKEQKLTAVGDDGMIVFDDREDWPTKLRLFRRPASWRPGTAMAVQAEAEPVPVAPAEPLRLECAHFLECATTGAPPLTGGTEGLNVLRVLCAIDASVHAKRPSPPTEEPAQGGVRDGPQHTAPPSSTGGNGAAPGPNRPI